MRTFNYSLYWYMILVPVKKSISTAWSFLSLNETKIFGTIKMQSENKLIF